MSKTDSGVDWAQVCMAPAELKLASIGATLGQAEDSFWWHSHPFFECGLVLEGGCSWHIGADTYDLIEGEVIIVPQGAVHREWVAPGARARLSWIGFSHAAVPQHGAEQSDAITMLVGVPGPAGIGRGHNLFIQNMPEGYASGEVELGGALKPLKVPLGRWSTEIRRLFLTIYDEQSESAFGAETRIGLSLRELLLLFIRSTQAIDASQRAQRTSAEGVPLRQVQIVHAASRYFDNNTEQGVTIESVARYFRLTPQYFSTLFRKVHGMSPARYQQEARVRHACRLLLGSQLSIKEIASLCGYADSPHFCRQFKTHEGCTPAEYRLRKRDLIL